MNARVRPGAEKRARYGFATIRSPPTCAVGVSIEHASLHKTDIHAPLSAQMGGFKVMAGHDKNSYNPSVANYGYDGLTFVTAEEQEEITEFEKKYLSKEAADLLRLVDDRNQSMLDREQYAERYLESYGMPDDLDAVRIQELHAKVCKSHGAAIDFEDYWSLKMAGDRELIDADKRIYDLERARYDKVQQQATRVVFGMLGIRRSLNQFPAIFLSDAERDAMVEKWEKRKRFNDARKEFEKESAELMRVNGMVAAGELAEEFPAFVDNVQRSAPKGE